VEILLLLLRISQKGNGVPFCLLILYGMNDAVALSKIRLTTLPVNKRNKCLSIYISDPSS
jgi:hypothetical protein